MNETATSIRGQYLTLIGISSAALAAWLLVTGVYHLFGFTPGTAYEDGGKIDQVISALQKPLSVIGLLLALAASATAARLLWKLEQRFEFLKGSWRAAANVGAVAFYTAGGNAAAALIGLYLLGVTPALGTGAQLAVNLLPFGAVFLLVPAALGTFLAPPAGEA